MGWQTHTYTGGRYQPIADLLKDGSHRIEAWGNAWEGWFPYLVSGNAGISCGPYFGPDQGDRLRDLKAAAARCYGIPASAVKRGKGWW